MIINTNIIASHNPNPMSLRTFNKHSQLFSSHIYVVVNLPEIFHRLKRCQFRDRILVVFRTIVLGCLALFTSETRLPSLLLVPETVPILHWGGTWLWYICMSGHVEILDLCSFPFTLSSTLSATVEWNKVIVKIKEKQ